MTIQRRYANAGIGTANVNVGIPSGNSVAILSGSICNKTNQTISANVWLVPASGANASYTSNMAIPANATFTIFGSDQKHFLLSGDTIWANCNVNNGYDLIISTSEGL